MPLATAMPAGTRQAPASKLQPSPAVTGPPGSTPHRDILAPAHQPGMNTAPYVQGHAGPGSMYANPYFSGFAAPQETQSRGIGSSLIENPLVTASSGAAFGLAGGAAATSLLDSSSFEQNSEGGNTSAPPSVQPGIDDVEAYDPTTDQIVDGVENDIEPYDPALDQIVDGQPESFEPYQPGQHEPVKAYDVNQAAAPVEAYDQTHDEPIEAYDPTQDEVVEDHDPDQYEAPEEYDPTQHEAVEEYDPAQHEQFEHSASQEATFQQPAEEPPMDEAKHISPDENIAYDEANAEEYPDGNFEHGDYGDVQEADFDE